MQKWTPTTDSLQLRRFGKLGEELGELQAVAARCIIQGIDEIDPSSGRPNRDRLEDEIADVYAQLNVLINDLELDYLYILRRTQSKVGSMRKWDELLGKDFKPAPLESVAFEYIRQEVVKQTENVRKAFNE